LILLYAVKRLLYFYSLLHLPNKWFAFRRGRKLKKTEVFFLNQCSWKRKNKNLEFIFKFCIFGRIIHCLKIQVTCKYCHFCIWLKKITILVAVWTWLLRLGPYTKLLIFIWLIHFYWMKMLLVGCRLWYGLIRYVELSYSLILKTHHSEPRWS
jgi:hypothetical protein